MVEGLESSDFERMIEENKGRTKFKRLMFQLRNIGYENTITDGGSTATHSKDISGWIGWMDPT